MQQPDNEGKFLHHTSCDACGSSDARGIYENNDGTKSSYCFSCSTYQPDSEGDGTGQAAVQNKSQAKQTNLLKGEAKSLPARGLTEADCEKFSYWVGHNHQGELVQIANYRDATGKIVRKNCVAKASHFSS